MNRVLVARQLVKAARELLGAGKWEAPNGMRRTWRRKKDDGSYEYRTHAPSGEQKPAKPSGDVRVVGKPSGSSGSSDLAKHKKVTPSVKSLSRVKNVMSANSIDEESDEVHELMGFKKMLGQRVPESKKGDYYVRNEAKLKADFIKNMNPSNYDSPEAFKAAKERMQKMPTGDFGKVLAAIAEEEE